MLTSNFLVVLLGSSAMSSTIIVGAAFQARQTFLGSSTTPPFVRHSVPPAQCSPAPRKALRCSLEGGEDVSLGRRDALPVRESQVHDEYVRSSRRTFASKVAAGFGAAAAAATAATTTTALGAAVAQTASSAGTSRSAEDVKRAIETDFVARRYYVTGDLTPSLYRPDCLFTDPTTRVAGVERYVAAVKLLFDPDNAQADLLSLKVKDDTHIFAEWRLQGYLKFPWHPYVKPYTGTTLYTLDSDGFITSHEETWSITALDAARATITPTTGPQAAKSTTRAPS